VTFHLEESLQIKPTRCTNFSNLFLEWNSTCFGQFLCTSSGVFHCTHSNGICHTNLLTACGQDHDGTHPDPARKLSRNLSKNCPKHVEIKLASRIRMELKEPE